MATQTIQPPAFFGVGVGLGVDGVVVVAGVDRVDGDERQVAQVVAALQRRRLGGLGLGLGVLGEAGRDAVGVDGDQRGGARIVLAADHLQQLAALGAVAGGVAVRPGPAPGRRRCRSSAASLGQQQAVLGLAVDRLDPHLAARACGSRPGCWWALWPRRLISRASVSPFSSFSKRTSSRSPRPGARRPSASPAGGQAHQRARPRRLGQRAP